jgi:hypothetical protein
MSLTSVLCTAALVTTAFDIIVGFGSVRLRPVRVPIQDAGKRR